jgi:hypothetical protein
MATTNMKRIVANALASHIASNVAGLAGKVTAVAAGPETDLPCLAAKIISDRFTFEPSQEDEVYEADPDDGKIITDVGSWTGNFTIELYTNSPAEREQYEQAIIDLFMETEWAPGTLFISTPALTVGGYVSLHTAEIKFRLEGENWADEMSFEAKRYTFLDVYVDFPALVLRTAADLDIQLFFHPDTSVEITDTGDIDDDLQVRVDEEGQTTPVEDPAP